MKLRIVLTLVVLLLGLTLISGSAAVAEPTEPMGMCPWPVPWLDFPTCPQAYNGICLCRAGQTCVGTQYTDIIIGTNGPDLIYGLGGDDWICGYGGGDWIFGGQGNDHLAGDTGNDYLFGQAGADEVLGEAGDDDYCFGGPNPAGTQDTNDDAACENQFGFP